MKRSSRRTIKGSVNESESNSKKEPSRRASKRRNAPIFDGAPIIDNPTTGVIPSVNPQTGEFATVNFDQTSNHQTSNQGIGQTGEFERVSQNINQNRQDVQQDSRKKDIKNNGQVQNQPLPGWDPAQSAIDNGAYSGGVIEHNELQRAKDIASRIEGIFAQRVVGQERLRVALLTTLIAGGHILIESVPGLAKTTAARALCSAIQGKFSRIQCTPDLMP
ncbi:MAG: MoxR family ATPase, partial [Candidatus Ancillula sp.]|nr:MoxR family ATPase [Candidatus Ancillula sp.]